MRFGRRSKRFGRAPEQADGIGRNATGGTCFGDSGGPTFDNTSSNLIVAVTSRGQSPNCSGKGGVYRLDQPDDQAFLAGFGIHS